MKYISNVKRLSSCKYTFFQLFIIHKKKYIELLKLLQIPLISKQRIKDRCLFAKERQILSLCTITATSTLGERLYSSVAFRDKATLHLSLSLSFSFCPRARNKKSTGLERSSHNAIGYDISNNASAMLPG